MNNAPAVVIHVPHASVAIPPELRGQFVLSEADLSRELDLITDHYTDDLFTVASSEATTISFPVSRLVVDPERFEFDNQEPMAERGMGAVYMKTTHQQRLRQRLKTSEREQLLDTYYRPHHRALATAVDAALAANGRCLLIDAHSFPAVPLPYELDQLAARPDFCIGTDDYHTPSKLAEEAAAAFSDHGFSVLMNRPFGGSIVPMSYYRQDARVCSVMIEVNRALYLQPPDSAIKGSRFDETRLAVQGCVERLTGCATNLH